MTKNNLLKIAKEYGIEVGEDIFQSERVNTELDNILLRIYEEEFGKDFNLSQFSQKEDKVR